jgi:hypothetical protein
VIWAQAVTFFAEKDGNSVVEYEDGAGGVVGDPAAGIAPRFVVLDGATEAYDAARWVGELISSFISQEHPLGQAPPTLDRASMRRWLDNSQRRWLDEAPARFASVFEEIKFREDGSFATFVGCELVGLADGRPRWDAIALGDSLLFHVRGNRCIRRFPHLTAADFGLSPAGVSTRPAALAGMIEALEFDTGELAVGDLLYLATDAMALWIVQRMDAEDLAIWPMLARFDHAESFGDFVSTQRAGGELRNDDITLMRVQVVDEPPSLVVAL